MVRPRSFAWLACLVVLAFFLDYGSCRAIDFGIKNTPLDPKTWEKTIQNTPFDPSTWDDFLTDLLNPQAVPCKQIYNTIHDISCQRSNNCGLTHAEKFYLRPFFGDLVDSAQVFTGVGLEYSIAGVRVDRDAAAITAGNRITTQQYRDELYPGWILLLAHEMTHVHQYAQTGRDRFCEAYTNDFINGFDYYAIPFEHSAFSLEFRFAHYLRRLHSGYDYDLDPVYIHESHSPYIRRTAVLPSMLYKPPQEYGITSITNTLDRPITFQWHNEGGPPKTSEVSPGRRFYIRHTYPGGKVTSPRLLIKFGNVEIPRRYRLERYRTTDPESIGKSYRFALREGLVDLVESAPEDERMVFKFNGGTFINVGHGRWALKLSDGNVKTLTEAHRDRTHVVLSDDARREFRLSDTGVEARQVSSSAWLRYGGRGINSNNGWVDIRPPKERAPLLSDLTIPPPSAGIPEVELDRGDRGGIRDDDTGSRSCRCCCCCRPCCFGPCGVPRFAAVATPQCFMSATARPIQFGCRSRIRLRSRLACLGQRQFLTPCGQNWQPLGCQTTVVPSQSRASSLSTRVIGGGLGYEPSISAVIAKSSAPELFTRGRQLYRSGTFHEAARMFEGAAERERSAYYVYCLALAQYELGTVNRATANVRRAAGIELDAPVVNWGMRMERFQGKSRLWLEKERTSALKLARHDDSSPGLSRDHSRLVRVSKP